MLDYQSILGSKKSFDMPRFSITTLFLKPGANSKLLFEGSNSIVEIDPATMKKVKVWSTGLDPDEGDYFFSGFYF